MDIHNTNLALQLVPASSRPLAVGEPRLWIAEALEVCDTSVVARRLSCSQELVRELDGKVIEKRFATPEEATFWAQNSLSFDDKEVH